MNIICCNKIRIGKSKIQKGNICGGCLPILEDEANHSTKRVWGRKGVSTLVHMNHPQRHAGGAFVATVRICQDPTSGARVSHDQSATYMFHLCTTYLSIYYRHNQSTDTTISTGSILPLIAPSIYSLRRYHYTYHSALTLTATNPTQEAPTPPVCVLHTNLPRHARVTMEAELRSPGHLCLDLEPETAALPVLPHYLSPRNLIKSLRLCEIK
jgi:hypothetical protein